jgi:hypothetical protein
MTEAAVVNDRGKVALVAAIAIESDVMRDKAVRRN